jgi:hypothetical protein
MTTSEFITELFCRVDDEMTTVPKHPQASLWTSEVVTLGLLFALKGVGDRAFYRWAAKDLRSLFPRLPERPRLFRLCKAHQAWTTTFNVPDSTFHPLITNFADHMIILSDTAFHAAAGDPANLKLCQRRNGSSLVSRVQLVR